MGEIVESMVPSETGRREIVSDGNNSAEGANQFVRTRVLPEETDGKLVNDIG